MRNKIQIQPQHKLQFNLQLKQAIDLLSLSSTDLNKLVSEWVLENPFLEIQAVPSAPSKNSVDWVFNQSVANYSSSDWLENQYAEPMQRPLESYLLWQIDLNPCSEAERQMARQLILEINPDTGYLNLNNIDLKNLSNLTLFEKSLSQIRQLDPVGVGSRNLSECLSSQVLARQSELVVQLGEFLFKTLKNLVSDSELLQAIASHRIKQLRKKLNIQTESDWKLLLDFFYQLDPCPAKTWLSRHRELDSTEVLIPDLWMVQLKNQWTVQLNPQVNPTLVFNKKYFKSFKHPDRDTKKYLKYSQVQAQWSMESLSRRHEQLLKLGQAILDSQKRFLEYGPQALQPMTRTHIARKLSMHESTVSRLVQNKSIWTPYGVWELKKFFSSALKNIDFKRRISAQVVYGLLTRWIKTESGHRPFRDQELVQKCLEEGIVVSRRTIAKYRQQLKIKPSGMRRRS